MAAANETQWKDALLRLLSAVMADGRLSALHPKAAASIRALDTRAGDRILVQRFEASPASVNVLDAYAAWARLGCDASSQAGTVLRTLLLEELQKRSTPKEREKLLPFDRELAANVAHISDGLVLSLARAVEPYSLRLLREAIAERVVTARMHRTEALLALVDDDELKVCWPKAFAALLADAHASEGGVRAVLERFDRAPPKVVEEALAKSSAAEAYDAIAPQLDVTSRLWSMVNGLPAILRDARWLELANEMSSRTSGAGDMIRVIASDPDNPSHDRAIGQLIEDVERHATTDVVGRRFALTALGETGSALATPTLLTAFHDPKIGSAMALTLEAIGRCANVDAIPIIESKLNGPWRSYIESAVTEIRARAGQLNRERILAACGDADPVIADLARRARDGDSEARVVLEDAMRERTWGDRLLSS